MKQPLANRFPFAKIMVVLAVIFGISLGLCGITLVFATTSRSSNGGFLGPLAVTELIAMLVSAIGLVVTAIAWVIAIVIGGARNTSGPPPTILEGEVTPPDTEGDEK